MKYYLPIHLNGGNRGCEAITKGIAEILGTSKESVLAYSSDIGLDSRLGLDEKVTLIPCRKYSLLWRITNRFYRLFVSKPFKRSAFGYSYFFKPFLSLISKEDLMLSTGGDMLCYGDNEVIYTNDCCFKQGIKTILFGCSVGENNLSPLKKETLKHFYKIFARESITYEMLKSLGLKNVYLFPDPAFILQPEKFNLPDYYINENLIGINISNYILENNSFDTANGQNVLKLFDKILNETDLTIVLIPHVLWKGQDDRIVTKLLYEKYGISKRIHVLDTDRLNYCQIRYAISKLRFFIGARTHSVISAYSTCVPSVALGYSVKSRGIAKDLGLNDELVYDSKNVKNTNELCDRFAYLINNEDGIRQRLTDVIPDYIQSIWKIKEQI